MTEDAGDPGRYPVSRRRLLAGMSGIGAVSGIGGAGSVAYLSDTELFEGNAFTAGDLGIDLSCTTADCVFEDGVLGVDFSGIEPGDRGDVTIELTGTGNPARAWMATACPPLLDPLGDRLHVDLVLEPNCDGPGEDAVSLFSGSLNDLRRDLHVGERLGTGCLDPGVTHCLRLEWSLPLDSTETLVSLTSRLDLQFYVEQCRHVPETSATNPFGDREACPEFECPECRVLGKVDTEEDVIGVGDRLPLETEDWVGDRAFTLEVLSVVDKVGGEERETVCVGFRLLELIDDEWQEGGVPPLCEVAIGGGSPKRSPKEGGGGPPNEVVYDVEPPSTRTDGNLCAEFDDFDEGDEDRNRPGISHITVSVCGEPSDEPDGGQRVSCPRDGDENGKNGERIVEASFEYDGSSGEAVDVAIVQQSTGEVQDGGPFEDVEPGDSFTVPLSKDGKLDFDVLVDDESIGSFHTSCSRPFGPGLRIGDETTALIVLKARDAAGNRLCEVSTDA